MARVDEEPEERHQHTIIVSCNIDCPKCGTTFDQDFDTGEYEEEMITERATAKVKCPNVDCLHEFVAEYEGYIVHGDAG